jgi:hypothetical protein
VGVVHTAWARDPKFIVSMLSLDLSGAFDKVSHDRLLWILWRKRLPEWMVKFVQGFLVGRMTQLTYSGFPSDMDQKFFQAFQALSLSRLHAARRLCYKVVVVCSPTVRR